MAFAEEKFSRMLSFSVTIGLLGAIYGGGPVSYMKQVLGYDRVVFLFAAIGIALSVITFWLVPEVKSHSKVSIFSSLKQVFGNKKVVCLCIFAGLMVGPLEGFADVWGGVFLERTHQIDKTLASSLLSFIFLGMCFGGPVLSIMAEKTRSYLGTVAIAAVCMALAFCVLLGFFINSIGLGAIFLLIGICSAYQILAIYKASTYVAEEVAGLTTAVANMIIMIFGYVVHTTIGSVVKLFGGTSSKAALCYGVSVIPIALTLGGLGFLWLIWQDKKLEKTA
jgi:hypothetical protein